MPELVKIELPKVHIVNGKEFPVAYSLESESPKTPDEIVEFLKSEAQKDVFNKLVAKHGALVIRNTGTTDPETLSRYIKAIGYGSGSDFFVQNGSTAKRTELTDIISTANEGPSDMIIHQHNEFSRFKKYPTTLFFCCTKYDAKGGETPIVHGAEFFNSLNAKVPEFLKLLSERGLYMAQIWPNESTTNTSWRDYFCFGRNITTEDDLEVAKAKAEEIVKAKISDDYEWVGEDKLDLHVHQHTVPIRLFKNKFTGEEAPTFFNSLATYYYQYKQKEYNTATSNITFDDGSAIKTEWLEELLQDSLDLSYDHQWQEGDIAIVDNLQVSHGRLPWSDGSRTVVVSMWGKDDVNYEGWKP